MYLRQPFLTQFYHDLLYKSYHCLKVAISERIANQTAYPLCKYRLVSFAFILSFVLFMLYFPCSSINRIIHQSLLNYNGCSIYQMIFNANLEHNERGNGKNDLVLVLIK